MLRHLTGIKSTVIQWIPLTDFRRDMFLQIAAVSIYTLLGMFSFGFMRPDYGLATSVGSAIATDLALNLLLRRQFKFSQGSIIAGISLFLLIESPISLMPYAAGGFVSQLSKRIFRINDRHVFNPSNLAVVFCLYFLPDQALFTPGQWNSSPETIAFAMTIGMLVCTAAGRLPVSIAYMAGFVLMSGVRSWFSPGSVVFYAGTILGVPQTIYTFHMVTDPKTSPNRRDLQILYGAAIGITDAVLRWMIFLNSPAISLVFVCAVWPILELSAKHLLDSSKEAPQDFRKQVRRTLVRLSPSLLLVVIISVWGIKNDMLRFDPSPPPQQLYESSRFESHRPPFHFEEVGESLGITHIHECYTADETTKNIGKQTCAGNSAVAVADVNNDDRPDLFFTTMREGKPNRLYLNKGNGKFLDFTEASGLGVDRNDPSPALTALFFDYDNNGTKDLLVLRAGCHSLYRNDGRGHFQDASAESGLNRICGNAVSVNALDFDKDGYLDLVIGNFWRGVGLKNRNDAVMPARSFYTSRDGGRNIVLRNNQGRDFVDISQHVGFKDGSYTWAFGVGDFNQDGFPDLMLANDFGPSNLWLNQAGRFFLNVSRKSGISRVGRAGMNSDIADFDNTGQLGAYITNITWPGMSGWASNTLWQNNGNSTFSEIASSKGAARCGWGWGAKFADFDGDGWLDLFVTSGFWTGQSKRSYFYPMMTSFALPNFIKTHQKYLPQSQLFSFAPDHENCLFHRAGNRFVDVSKKVGVAEAANGKGVAIIDMRSDGSADIVVARTEGRPFIYKNIKESKFTSIHHWIGFQLVGTKSNRDAWGARVYLETSKLKQMRELYPANGFKGQSDSRLMFGLGSDPQIRSIRVDWPSGVSQQIKNWKLNAYQKIVEPNTKTSTIN